MMVKQPILSSRINFSLATFAPHSCSLYYVFLRAGMGFKIHTPDCEKVALRSMLQLLLYLDTTVVVAQLVERLPPTPEDRGSNLDIGKS